MSQNSCMHEVYSQNEEKDLKPKVKLRSISNQQFKLQESSTF
jgi:hypothetical protein